MSEATKKYLVEYTLAYNHIVRVGVKASDADEASQTAEDAFNEGTIWDNTPSMPLIYDDFEEQEDNVLMFTATEVGEWPEADNSVVSQQDLMNAKQERDSLKVALRATQETQSQAMQYADKLEKMLVRLIEKIDRANSIRTSGSRLQPEDWSELLMMVTEAKTIVKD